MPFTRLSFLRHPFIAASGTVFAGAMAANILNYLFNLAAGRFLAPAVYGEAAALVSIAMIISVPSATLMTLLAKYTALYRSRGNAARAAAVFRLAHRTAWMAGASLALFLALFAQPLAHALHTKTSAVLLFLLLLPLSMANAAVKGGLQGAHHFRPYAVSTAIEAGGKLACGVTLLALGFSLTGVIIALMASAAASYGYGLRRLGASPVPSAHPHSDTSLSLRAAFRRVPRYAWIVFLSALLTALFANSHVVLAKHFLSPLDGGHYAALAVLGRIVLYGGGAAASVLLPMASAGSPPERRRLLLLALASVSALSAAAVIVFALFPRLVILALFGGRYSMVAPLLPLMGIGQAFLALATLLVQHFIASHRTWFLLPYAAAVLLQNILIIRFHTDTAAITASVAAANIFLFAALLPFVWREPKTIPPPPTDLPLPIPPE